VTDYDTIIIGGGHNGLITAAYLAKSGIRTLVLERRDMVGGACVTEEIAGAPGFRVSTGAAQLGNLRPEIIEDLDLVAFGYELIMPDPVTVFPFPDGRHLALWCDAERTRAEFAKFSARDAEALPEYQADCTIVCDLLEALLYDDKVPTPKDLARMFVSAGRSDLFKSFVLGSMAELLDSRFESDQVKAVLGYTATFGTNADPYTPGTAYVMAHHLFGATAGVRGRAGYVKGGMGGLADALARAATHHGAEIRTGTSVDRVVMKNGAACGVVTTAKEYFPARAVISNADPQRTFLGLVGRDKLSPNLAEAIEGIEMQGVALKVNCALDRLPTFTAMPEGVTPSRVSLCPSMDYVADAWAEAADGRFSSAPYMTIHMQSLVDDTLAPAGKHTLTCYAQFFPYNLAPELGGWEQQRDVAEGIVLDTVAAYAPDIRDCVIATETVSPLDLEDRFGMTGGHQFHGDLMPGQLFDQRPAPGCAGARTPIDGLYLCGTGTHPGGCVWGAPGLHAASAVVKDLNNEGRPKKGFFSRINPMHSRNTES
jgi:phytoene dehydrogenase-like protein